MNKPYKLKHVPTGLYYQPHKHNGSNLSKTGRIYQTSTHGLSSAMKSERQTFSIQVAENGVVHRLTKDILIYREVKWAYRQLIADTSVKDWEIEYIG